MNDSFFGSWENAVCWLVEQAEYHKLVRSCYYDSPLSLAALRYWESDEWISIRKFYPRKIGFALDIGAGNGIASYALARDGWRVTAIEPDPSNIVGAGAIRTLADSEGLLIDVVQEFGERIPLADNVYDMVLARQVLHHAVDLNQLCREIYRVLKPGGIAVMIREHVITRKSDLKKFYAMHPLHWLYGGEYAYLLGEYKSSIRQSGLDLVKTIGPFDSVINYAPYTESAMRSNLQNRLSHIPGGFLLSAMLRFELIFKIGLKVLSKVDQRPGRLFSFVCRKKEV